MLPPCGWFRCRCTADWIGSFHFAASSSQERRYFRLAGFSLSNQLPRWFSSATQSNKKEPDKLTLKAHYFIAAHNHLIATAVRLVGMTGLARFTSPLRRRKSGDTSVSPASPCQTSFLAGSHRPPNPIKKSQTS